MRFAVCAMIGVFGGGGGRVDGSGRELVVGWCVLPGCPWPRGEVVRLFRAGVGVATAIDSDGSDQEETNDSSRWRGKGERRVAGREGAAGRYGFQRGIGLGLRPVGFL